MKDTQSFVLQVVAGYNRGQRYTLPEGRVLIGRAETSTVRLLDDSVSREHCALQVTPERVSLQDASSRNGSRVNGVPCEAAELLPGDRLGVGALELVLAVLPASTVSGSSPTGDLHAPQVPRSEDPELALPEVCPGVDITGDSPPMRKLFGALGRVAGAACAVLVRGETGSGKELVARALHALSPRRRAPFVAVNCASLDGPLLESELFGHERGAFSGAVARKQGLIESAGAGSLFLDEVGELSGAAQAKLLRVLEDGEWRRVGGLRSHHAACRVLTATHRDLAAMVRAGDFREDLLYRLSVVELLVPPLRARGADITLLAEQFCRELCAASGRRLQLSAEALTALQQHAWPGNVRQLRNAVERAVILARGPQLRAADFGLEDAQATAKGFPSLAELERRHILRALEEADGQRAQAAALLGIDRKTLYRKLKGYGIAAKG